MKLMSKASKLIPALMEHYQADSTGTDEDGFLLFDWGRLRINTDTSSIFVEAYIVTTHGQGGRS